jgi:uncharacterized membrane protein
MESTIAVVVLSLGAIGEYINDKRPNTPSRTAPLSFIARLVTGGASGACLCVSAGRSLALGGFMGALGAVIGTLGGYLARTRLVKALNVRDVFVAIPEDLIAIAVGFLTISLAFTR